MDKIWLPQLRYAGEPWMVLVVREGVNDYGMVLRTVAPESEPAPTDAARDESVDEVSDYEY